MCACQAIACSTPGMPIEVTVVKSSGFEAYDHTIVDTIKRTWRYEPPKGHGQAIGVCAVVTFIYSQR